MAFFYRSCNVSSRSPQKALDEFQASKVSVDPRLSAAIVDACIRIPDVCAGTGHSDG